MQVASRLATTLRVNGRPFSFVSRIVQREKSSGSFCVTRDITERFIPVAATTDVSMQRRFSILLGVIAICSACRSMPVPTRASDCENPNPFGLASSLAPPQVPNPTISVGATAVVGTMVDSNTGRGLNRAALRLLALDQTGRDTTLVVDGSGAFSMSVPPGRYRVTTLAVNYQRLQTAVEFRAPAETLRIVLRRGLALCDVRLTNSGSR